MSRRAFLDCEDKTCSYHRMGVCIAERVHLVVEDGWLVCETHEDRELDYDPPDPNDYEWEYPRGDDHEW